MRGVGNRHSCKTRDSSLPSKKGAQCEPDGEESMKKGKNVGFQRSLFSDEISPLRAFGAPLQNTCWLCENDSSGSLCVLLFPRFPFSLNTSFLLGSSFFFVEHVLLRTLPGVGDIKGPSVGWNVGWSLQR